MKGNATVAVAETSDPVQAGLWVDALRQAGIRAAVFERGMGGALGGADTYGFSVHRVIVGYHDLARARSIIAELGGAAALMPYRTPGEEGARAMRMLGIIAGSMAVVIAAALALRAFL
ncbi:MAG: hypothetical protein Kow0010_13320 [Dehalococcoidia bacterium]